MRRAAASRRTRADLTAARRSARFAGWALAHHGRRAGRARRHHDALGWRTSVRSSRPRTSVSGWSTRAAARRRTVLPRRPALLGPRDAGHRCARTDLRFLRAREAGRRLPLLRALRRQAAGRARRGRAARWSIMRSMGGRRLRGVRLRARRRRPHLDVPRLWIDAHGDAGPGVTVRKIRQSPQTWRRARRERRRRRAGAARRDARRRARSTAWRGDLGVQANDPRDGRFRFLEVNGQQRDCTTRCCVAPVRRRRPHRGASKGVEKSPARTCAITGWRGTWSTCTRPAASRCCVATTRSTWRALMAPLSHAAGRGGVVVARPGAPRRTGGHARPPSRRGASAITAAAATRPRGTLTWGCPGSRGAARLTSTPDPARAAARASTERARARAKAASSSVARCRTKRRGSVCTSWYCRNVGVVLECLPDRARVGRSVRRRARSRPRRGPRAR